MKKTMLMMLLVLVAGCSIPAWSAAKKHILSPDTQVLAQFALECPYVDDAWEPVPPLEQVNQILVKYRQKDRTSHFPYLLEYGLRVYWKNLVNTGIARELPVKNNLMLAELIRLAEIPKYTSAHEAGWLNRQFPERFDGRGYSSYQVYLWVKEHSRSLLASYSNGDRLVQLLSTIERSNLNQLGGLRRGAYSKIPVTMKARVHQQLLRLTLGGWNQSIFSFGGLALKVFVYSVWLVTPYSLDLMNW